MKLPTQSKPIIKSIATSITIAHNGLNPSGDCGCPNKCLGTCVDGKCLGPCV